VTTGGYIDLGGPQAQLRVHKDPTGVKKSWIWDGKSYGDSGPIRSINDQALVFCIKNEELVCIKNEELVENVAIILATLPKMWKIQKVDNPSVFGGKEVFNIINESCPEWLIAEKEDEELLVLQKSRNGGAAPYQTWEIVRLDQGERPPQDKDKGMEVVKSKRSKHKKKAASSTRRSSTSPTMTCGPSS